MTWHQRLPGTTHHRHVHHDSYLTLSPLRDRQLRPSTLADREVRTRDSIRDVVWAAMPSRLRTNCLVNRLTRFGRVAFFRGGPPLGEVVNMGSFEFLNLSQQFLGVTSKFHNGDPVPLLRLTTPKLLDELGNALADHHEL